MSDDGSQSPISPAADAIAAARIGDEEQAFNEIAAAIETLPEDLRAIARRMYGVEAESGALHELMTLPNTQVERIVAAVCPHLAEPVMQAWTAWDGYPMRVLPKPPGQPSGVVDRGVWIRDLTKELAGVRIDGDPIRWLAVHGEGFRERLDPAMRDFYRSFGVSLSGSGTDDHIGRLLAVELFRQSEAADDVFDTLALIVAGRHPVGRVSTHLTRALASSGLAAGHDLLITLLGSAERPEGEDRTAIAGDVLHAAREALPFAPDLLADVLEAIGYDDSLDHAALAAEAATALGLPSELLETETVVGTPSELYLMASRMLRNESERAAGISGDDPVALLFALWAIATEDGEAAIAAAADRFAAASSEDDLDETIRTVILLFAQQFESPSMRPLWVRMLDVWEAKCVGLLAGRVLQFRSAAGVRDAEQTDPDGDDAFERLERIATRVLSDSDAVAAAGAAFDDEPERQPDLLRRAVGELLIANRGSRPAARLRPFVDLLPPGGDWMKEIGAAALPDENRIALFERALRSGSPDQLRDLVPSLTADELIGYASDKRPKWQLLGAIETHPERLAVWTALLAAKRKPVRESGLRSLTRSCERRELDDDLRRDLAAALDAYEEADAKKKRPDGYTSWTETIRDAVRTDDEAAAAANAYDDSVRRVIAKVIERTGLDASLFDLPAAEGPTDHGTTTAELLPPEDRGFLTWLDGWVERLNDPITAEVWTMAGEQPAELRQADTKTALGWSQHLRYVFRHQNGEPVLRKADEDVASIWAEAVERAVASGHEFERAVTVHRLHQALADGYWTRNGPHPPGQQQVSDARAMAPPPDAIAELKNAELVAAALDGLHRLLTITETGTACDWPVPPGEPSAGTERMLATLTQYIETIMTTLESDFARSRLPSLPWVWIILQRHLEAASDGDLRDVREWRLRMARRFRLEHAASDTDIGCFPSGTGGRRQAFADVVAPVVAAGRATLGELVWALCETRYDDPLLLLEAAESPEILERGLDAGREHQMRQVLDAVVAICREQEHSPDESLPEPLRTKWNRLPAPAAESGLGDVLTAFSELDHRVRSKDTKTKKAKLSAKDQKSLQAALGRVGDALREETDAILEAARPDGPNEQGQYLRETPDDCAAQRAEHTELLQRLLADGSLTEDSLLRAAFRHDRLMVPALAAIGREELTDAVAWIFAHADHAFDAMAVALGETEYSYDSPGFEFSHSPAEQVIARWVPDARFERFNSDARYMTEGTLRRDWFEAAIAPLDRETRDRLIDCYADSVTLSAPFQLTASPSVKAARLMRQIVDALAGEAKRPAIEKKLGDKANDAFLLLMLLPLPGDEAERIADLTARLEAIDRVDAAGRAKSTSKARRTARTAVDRARRTLAAGAGLSGPEQLDAIAGAALAAELAHFAHATIAGYDVQTRLDPAGLLVVVSKGGRRLKSIPTAVKSDPDGKRLLDLKKRLASSLKAAKASLEPMLASQRPIAAADLRMLLGDPAHAVLLSELVLIHDAADSSPVAGLLDDEGSHLVAADGERVAVTEAVRIAHPLTLDDLGTLAAWRSEFTDRPPQPFEQVERAFVRAGDLETAGDGERVLRHDQTAIREDQAIAVLKAHGWQNEYPIGLHRSLAGGDGYLTDFGDGTLGTLTFVPPHIDDEDYAGPQTAADLSPIALSELIRDLDRTVAAAA